MQNEKSVGAVLYQLKNSEPLFLISQHKNGGHWAFVKGHVEQNETEIETARREIIEETGLEQVELDLRFRERTVYSPKAGVEKEVIYFVGQIPAKETVKLYAQAEEVLALEWLAYSEAIKRLTYENDQKILAKAWAYLEFEKA